MSGDTTKIGIYILRMLDVYTWIKCHVVRSRGADISTYDAMFDHYNTNVSNLFS